MSKTIRVAFVGFGRRAAHYARLMGAMKEFDIVAAADVDPGIFNQNASAFPKVKYYGDWQEMLDKESFDLACVCSPDVFHEEQALAVLARKKHLLLEKPMALTAEGCLRILKAQREAGTRLFICFVLRYNGLYEKTRQLALDGAIGRVRAAWVQHSVTLNYFHNWMSQRAMSGGLLLQKGSHDIDMINWIVGGKPVKVSAFGGLDHFGGGEDDGLVCPECEKKNACPDSWLLKNAGAAELLEKQPYMRGQMLCAFRKGIDVWDNHAVNILYDNGVKASYTECHFAPYHRRNYLFIGEEGQVGADDLDGVHAITLIRRNGAKREVFMPCVGPGAHGGGDEGLLEDVRRCLLEGAEPIADGQAGFLSILAAEGAERSIAEGRTVDLAERLDSRSAVGQAGLS